MADPVYLSVNIFPGDGERVSWDFSFAGVSEDNASGTTPYLYPADIKAVEQYTDELGALIEIPRTITLTAPNRVLVAGDPVPVGREIKIYRSTEDRFPLVDYRDRQAVSEFDLDLQARQSLFVAMEVSDRSAMALFSASRAELTANQALTASELAVETADAAVATADSANTNAATALATANTAEANSVAALADAAAAFAAAAAVETLAQAAADDADAAAASALAAQSAADNAVTVANGVDGKAQTALDNSATAISTSSSALSVANGIDAKATDALANSIAAIAAANAAESTALGIDAKATQALADAAAANAAAAQAHAAADLLRSDLADEIQGVNLIGFQAAGVSARARTLARRFQLESTSRVHLIDYLTDAQMDDIIAGTRTLDCLPALNAAQAALGVDGGLIILPAGSIRLDGVFTTSWGVGLQGTGHMYSENGVDPGNTVIVPNHSGTAGISLVGSNGGYLSGFTIKSYPGVFPKTGVLAGRSSAASSGQHCIERVSVIGHYTTSCFYSIASEDTRFCQVYAWLFGGGAKHCFYTCISDALGVGGLTTSSNLHITLEHPFFISSATGADCSAVKVECGQASGSFTLIGGYFIAYDGAYIHMNMGGVDGQSPLGPFTFTGMSGERLTGGDPTYGFRITADTAVTLAGFTYMGSRLDLHASDTKTHYDIYVQDNITLQKPMIVVQPPEAFPYATSYVPRANVRGGHVSVGRVDVWTPLVMSSGWTSTFGTPYAQPAWRMDSTGRIWLRGTISGSALGEFAILPAGALPQRDHRWGTVSGNVGAARIRLNSATGQLILTDGATNQVELANISFDMT